MRLSCSAKMCVLGAEAHGFLWETEQQADLDISPDKKLDFVLEDISMCL